MNYYEELGISSSATAEEIRRAHRKLTRLLHPDQHTDEGLRKLAETQMRRLNAMVDVLVDPERRRQYDFQIQERPAPERATSVAPLRQNPIPVPHASFDLSKVWHTLPWWVWTTVGALVLTSAAVWFYADNLGSSFSNKSIAYTPSGATVDDGGLPKPKADGASNPVSSSTQPKNNPIASLTEKLKQALVSPSEPHPSEKEQSANNPAPARPIEVAQQTEKTIDDTKPVAPAPPHSVANDNTPTRAAVSTAQPGHKSDAVNLSASSNPAPATHGKPHEIASLPKTEPPVGAHVDTNTLAKAPPIVNVASVTPPALPSAPVQIQEPDRTGLAGEWVYAPKEPEKRKAGLYPPDFIELKLVNSSGELRGSYRARYVIGDNRDISPDVNFSIEQIKRDDSRTFAWEASNGSRGTLRIHPIDERKIRVEWRTTVRSAEPGLTTGIATLMRQ